MKKEWFIFLLILIVTVMVACQNSGSNADEEQSAIPVEVVDIVNGDVIQSLTFHGDIRAEIEVKVFAKIPDRIETFHVDEGDYIKKGDPIAKILATTIEQAVRQAEAHKTNLEAEYARAQRMRQEDAISQQQFDAIQTQVTQARAAFTSAQSQLGDATISAPISGIIGKRYYEAGDMASPAVPLVSIVQMDQVKITFDATEEDLGKLAMGQKAEVKARSYPGEIFEGKVLKISPVLDPMTRLAMVEVLIPNPKGKLKPGMYAEAEITIGILEDVLVVPRYSVIESTSLVQYNGEDKVVKNYFVYVVNDSNLAEQRKLDVSYVNYKRIAVKGGIQTGEQLVVSGQNNLRNGLLVLVSDEKEAE